MDIEVILLLITATVNSLLSLFVILGKRDHTNIIYSVFVIFASLWSIGLAFFILESNLSRSIYIANSYYVFALGIAIFFYCFSIIFLNKIKQNKIKYVLSFIPLILLTVLFILNKNLLLEQIIIRDWGKDVVINHFNYLIYGLVFMIFVILSYINLFKSYISKKDIIEKKQLKLILWGTSVGFLFGMIFDLILPFLGDYKHIFVGPVFSLFMVGSIAYAITKYQMFDIKIVVTQTLVIILWTSILVRIVILKSIEEQVSNVIFLLISIIIGFFIIKSVRKEVQQREHIEKLAKDLEVANEKLKELDQMKSEFLSLATHQIRAPLTAIRGYSSMLLEGDFGALPTKALDSVKIITKSSQNLINIVNDFLNISRIEQGRMIYEKNVFDIVEMVKEVADELKPNIKDAGLDLKVNIPDNLFMRVNGDRNKLRQVIGNLLDNATKYTLKGDIEISIMEENNLTAQAGKVKIEIKDTGVGIDPAEIGKLFNKFSRAKDANKTNVIGTGLGLYLAKKMIEAHDGHIQASSEGLGLGTTFTIELPLKK